MHGLVPICALKELHVWAEHTKNDNLLIKLMIFKKNATLEITRTCTINGPTSMDKSLQTFLHNFVEY